MTDYFYLIAISLIESAPINTLYTQTITQKMQPKVGVLSKAPQKVVTKKIEPSSKQYHSIYRSAVDDDKAKTNLKGTQRTYSSL